MTHELNNEFDVIVVGAGTSGCIIAGRLAVGSDARILLLEEGPDNLPEPVLRLETQRELLRSELVRRYQDQRTDGAQATLYSGRVLGGGWSVNQGGMVRPTSADLHQLSAAGGPAWARDHLIQLMVRLEDDVNFGDRPGHGSGGLIRIARHHRHGDAVAPAARDLLAVAAATGLPEVNDVNAEGDTSGVCAYPYAQDGGLRVSSATAHLAAARSRQNLEVRGDSVVRRVLIKNGRSVGVEVKSSQDPSATPVTIRAHRVVLCAGAFHSPQILQRSGIGPSAALATAGIAVAVDLPGVGAAFRDHAKAEIDLLLRPTTEDVEDTVFGDFGESLKLHLRLRSPHATVDPDLDLAVRHVAAEGRAVLVVRLLEQRVHGSITVDPADPDGLPIVRSGMLEHPDDIGAMVDGIMQGLALLHHPLLAGRYALPHGATNTPDTWRAMLRKAFGTYNHGCGTCRMGEGEGAVVSTDLVVLGVAGLMVADASVLPMLPHANTNLTVALVAEWAAEHLLEHLSRA